MKRKPKRAITLEKIIGGKTFNAYLRELEKKKEREESLVRHSQQIFIENQISDNNDEFKRDYGSFVMKLPLIKLPNSEKKEQFLPKILKQNNSTNKPSDREKNSNTSFKDQKNINRLSDTNLKKDIVIRNKGINNIVHNYNFSDIDNRMEEKLNSSNTNSDCNGYNIIQETNPSIFLTKTEHTKVINDKNFNNNTYVKHCNNGHKNNPSLNQIAEKLGKLRVYSNISIQNFLDHNYTKNFNSDNTIRCPNLIINAESCNFKAQKFTNMDFHSISNVTLNNYLSENEIHFINSNDNNYLMIGNKLANSENTNLESLVSNFSKSVGDNSRKNLSSLKLKSNQIKFRENNFFFENKIIESRKNKNKSNNSQCKEKDLPNSLTITNENHFKKMKMNSIYKNNFLK